MGSFHRRTALTRAAIVAAVVAATLSPAPGWAQEPSAEDQLDDARSQAAAVAAELDVIEAEDAEIQAALATIQTNVAGQQVVVNAANDAAAVAEAEEGLLPCRDRLRRCAPR